MPGSFVDELLQGPWVRAVRAPGPPGRPRRERHGDRLSDVRRARGPFQESGLPTSGGLEMLERLVHTPIAAGDVGQQLMGPGPTSLVDDGHPERFRQRGAGCRMVIEEPGAFTQRGEHLEVELGSEALRLVQQERLELDRRRRVLPLPRHRHRHHPTCDARPASAPGRQPDGATKVDPRHIVIGEGEVRCRDRGGAQRFTPRRIGKPTHPIDQPLQSTEDLRAGQHRGDTNGEITDRDLEPVVIGIVDASFDHRGQLIEGLIDP